MNSFSVPKTLENLPFSTEQVVGARARIGLVVLSSDHTIEHEFRLLLSDPGVDTYATRINCDVNVGPDTLKSMKADIGDAARLILPGERFDVMAYGCTSASAYLGDDTVDRLLCEGREPRPSLMPCTNPMKAAISAFKSLGVKRLAVLTPYVAEVNQQLLETLGKAGIDVPIFGSFNEPLDPVVGNIDTPSINAGVERLLDSAKADKVEVDGVFVSCTSLRLVHAIADMEKRFGLPVVSSNQALAWHCLRLAGIDAEMPEAQAAINGRLFGCALSDG